MNELELKNFFIHYLGAAVARHMEFRDFIGEFSWDFDIESGMVNLGQGGRYFVQFLGTRSNVDNTWLWSWSDYARQGMNPSCLQLADYLRAEAEAERLPEEFGTEKVSLDNWAPAIFAYICVARFQFFDFFECPYPDGMSYILVRGESPPPPLVKSALRAHTVLQAMLDIGPINAKMALSNYCHHVGLEGRENGDEMEIVADDGSLIAKFDEDDGFLESDLKMKSLNEKLKT